MMDACSATLGKLPYGAYGVHSFPLRGCCNIIEPFLVA